MVQFVEGCNHRVIVNVDKLAEKFHYEDVKKIGQYVMFNDFDVLVDGIAFIGNIKIVD